MLSKQVATNMTSTNVRMTKKNLATASLGAQHLYAFKTCWQHLRKTVFASLLTVAVIAIVLALPMGIFGLVSNLQQVSQHWQKGTQLSLYLNTNVSEQQVTELLSTLKQNPYIANLHYISPKQGLQQFQQQSKIKNILQVLKHNPLPGVIEIWPNASIHSAEKIHQLQQNLSTLPNVQSIQLDMQWIKRLYSILHLGDSIVFIFGILFALAVLLIVSNTIKLATQKRVEEITVMRLVGATNAFVRRPFLYTGITFGLLAGFAAWVIVNTAFSYLQSSVSQLADLYSSSFTLQPLAVSQLVLLMLIGALLGFIGSWFAVNRELRKVSFDS